MSFQVTPRKTIDMLSMTPSRTFCRINCTSGVMTLRQSSGWRLVVQAAAADDLAHTKVMVSVYGPFRWGRRPKTTRQAG
jgi:hypothetical protein